ncbi:hypothetical protein [Bradyrhizobium centrolobii]|uniref:hypothetical protein n=1 Tax=Bradyrhizobium centrolobii TaxID=1505087 RepID=UPI001FDA8A0E|nr:hypothetical protein [Bradyrhizobium centrolobii]
MSARLFMVAVRRDLPICFIGVFGDAFRFEFVLSDKVAPWRFPSRSAGSHLIVVEIIEANAGTMVDNDNNNRRRLVEFKEGCRYGKFGKTKAYELIATKGSGPTRWEARP